MALVGRDHVVVKQKVENKTAAAESVRACEWFQIEIKDMSSFKNGHFEGIFAKQITIASRST